MKAPTKKAISFQKRRNLHRSTEKSRVFSLLESLESRLLLSDFSWTGNSGIDSNWSTPSNWEDPAHHGTPSTVAPNAFNADVTIGGGASITMDISPTLANLVVQGTGATLNFNANTNLNIVPDTVNHTNGNIYLMQSPGVNTPLTIQTNSTTTTSTVSAYGLFVQGDKAGTSALTVQAHTAVKLSNNLDADGYKFDLTDAGTISALNAYLMGKDLPASGSPIASNDSVTGALSLSNELRIGGTGLVNFSVNQGAVTTNSFGVCNGSSLEVQSTGVNDPGSFNFNLASFIGDAPTGAAFTPLAALDQQPGSVITIHNNGRLHGLANLTISGGKSLAVTDSNGGAIVLGGSANILIGPSSVAGQLGPKVLITGTSGEAPTGAASDLYMPGGTVTILNNGAGANFKSGQLVVTSNGHADVSAIDVWSNVKEDNHFVEVLIADSADLLAGNIMLSGGPGGTPKYDYARMEVDDAAVSLSAVGTVMVIGDANTIANLHMGPGGTITSVTGGTISKDFNGTINDESSVPSVITPIIFGGVHAPKLLADIMPGDYYDGANENGPIINDASVDPYGVLTINGYLNDQGSLKLDGVIGASGQASELVVTGNATIAGDLSVAATLDSNTNQLRTYYLNDSFTLMHIGGTHTGSFENMPFDIPTRGSDNLQLPLLPTGEYWLLHYDTVLHDVVLMVTPAIVINFDGKTDLLANFVDGDANATSYTATINWLNGSSPVTGTITANSHGGFDLNADNPNGNLPGPYPLITIHDNDTNSWGGEGEFIPPLPDTPTALLAALNDSGQMALSWTETTSDPQDNYNDLPEGFTIERSVDGGAFYDIGQTGGGSFDTVSSNTYSFIDASADLARSNTYRIAAYDGQMPWSDGQLTTYSDSASFTPAAPAAPSALQGGLAWDNSGVMLQWQNNATNANAITIQRSTSADFSANLQQFTVPDFATSYEDTSASFATTYYYRLQAGNSGGVSSYAQTADASASFVSVTLPPAMAFSALSANANNGFAFTGILGTFTDLDPNAGTFSATIDWLGDGSHVTAGTVLTDGLGDYAIGGTYTFSPIGAYHPVITIQDQHGNSVTGTGTVTVATLVTSASFLGLDTTTQGNWSSAYGADGYNIVNDQASYPSYATVSTSGTTAWTWATSTTDIRGLEKADVPTDRIAGTWYTYSSFTMDVNLTDGQAHQVSIYAVDWDARGHHADILEAEPSRTLMRAGFGGRHEATDKFAIPARREARMNTNKIPG